MLKACVPGGGNGSGGCAGDANDDANGDECHDGDDSDGGDDAWIMRRGTPISLPGLCMALARGGGDGGVGGGEPLRATIVAHGDMVSALAHCPGLVQEATRRLCGGGGGGAGPRAVAFASAAAGDVPEAPPLVLCGVLDWAQPSPSRALRGGAGGADAGYAAVTERDAAARRAAPSLIAWRARVGALGGGAPPGACVRALAYDGARWRTTSRRTSRGRSSAAVAAGRRLPQQGFKTASYLYTKKNETGMY